MALTKVPSNLDATVATTQSASDNSTNVATTAYVTTAIANLVDGAPSTLNTLDEIAAALNDDAALNTTLTNSIATKMPLAGGTFTGNVNITKETPYLNLTDSSASRTLGVFVDDNNSVLRSSGQLLLQIGSTSAITIDSGKRVGINQVPGANNFALQVQGIQTDGSDARSVRIKGFGSQTSIGSTGPTLSIQNANTTANNYAKLGFESGNGGETVSINAQNTDHTNHYGDMAFNTRGSSGYSEKMRITSNGIVDINKATSFSSYPTGSQLNVYANGEGIRLDGSGATSRNIRFRNVSDANPGVIIADGSLKLETEDANTDIRLSAVRDIEYQVTSGNTTAGFHYFKSYNTTIMAIDGGNNRVGIGQSSPAAKLHVEWTGSQVSTDNIARITAPIYPSLEFYSTNSNSGNRNWKIAGVHNSYGTLEFLRSSTAGGVANITTLVMNSAGNIGIGTHVPDNVLHIKTTASGGPQIHLEDGTNSGFLGFDGSSIQLSTQRDMVDGTWHNTAKSWGGINIQGPAGGSQITMQTAPNSNTAPTTRFVIDKNGGTIIGSTANTAGHSFEAQDKSDGYSMLWTGRSSSGEGRGLTTAYGLLGVDGINYDGDGSYYPTAGFTAAADNASGESVDFWFGSSTSEWRPMVFFCIGAHTSGGLTGQTAGWALIRATHYNNGISFSILDSGGGGTWTTSVQGNIGDDRSDVSRCRIQYSSSQNRTVLSVWGANYSAFYGASRS